MQIKNPNKLLSEDQLSLLEECAKAPFALGAFRSLDDILTKLNVEVVIEPGIPERPIPSYFEEAEKYWKQKLEEISHRDSMELPEIRENIWTIQKEKGVWQTMTLRGLYDPKKNIIKLFLEEMQTEYNGKCMNELLVSTLAHETMHAYFNRSGHEKYPYVLFVEEPLAEFGMLLYLKETKSSYYDWAYNDVSIKQTCYKYGAKLMDQYLQGDATLRDYLQSYKIQLADYVIPAWKNNPISLPQSGASNPIVLGGKSISPQWHNLSYFYDKQTDTLGLDGDWTGIDQMEICRRYGATPKNIYFADGFRCDELLDGCYRCYDLAYISETINVIVSPKNKTYKQGSNGIPLLRKDNTPCLKQGLDGLYHICRNGKYGVVDIQLHVIVPLKYGFVCFCDENGLFLVKSDSQPGQWGLVNKQGIEQVPLIYEHITKNSNGTYTVQKDGKGYSIDKYGNRIH